MCVTNFSFQKLVTLMCFSQTGSFKLYYYIYSWSNKLKKLDTEIWSFSGIHTNELGNVSVEHYGTRLFSLLFVTDGTTYYTSAGFLIQIDSCKFNFIIFQASRFQVLFTWNNNCQAKNKVILTVEENYGDEILSVDFKHTPSFTTVYTRNIELFERCRIPVFCYLQLHALV